MPLYPPRCNHWLLVTSVAILVLGPTSTLAEERAVVVGNLEGTKLAFPANTVRNVEYDNDPGWGEVGRPTQRTFESGIRSLGFRLQPPHFALLKNSDGGTASAVSITVTANSYYGKGPFLTRRLEVINRDPSYLYSEAKEKFASLRHFELAFEPGTPQSDMRNIDVFVDTSRDGDVTTFIECGNTRGERSLCSHDFLVPSMKTKFTAMYRRAVLSNWREMEVQVVRRIRELQVD